MLYLQCEHNFGSTWHPLETSSPFQHIWSRASPLPDCIEHGAISPHLQNICSISCLTHKASEGQLLRFLKVPPYCTLLLLSVSLPQFNVFCRLAEDTVFLSVSATRLLVEILNSTEQYCTQNSTLRVHHFSPDTNWTLNHHVYPLAPAVQAFFGLASALSIQLILLHLTNNTGASKPSKVKVYSVHHSTLICKACHFITEAVRLVKHCLP